MFSPDFAYIHKAKYVFLGTYFSVGIEIDLDQGTNVDYFQRVSIRASGTTGSGRAAALPVG